MHARNDTMVVSLPGRIAAAAKLDERLLAEIDAHAPGLDEAERQRRLVHARKAHFQRLSLKGAKVLAAKRARKGAQREAAKETAATEERSGDEGADD
jgi:hypothetical protein